MRKKKKIQLNKASQKKKIRIPFKTFLLISAILFSGLMVLGNTYAWFTSSDSKKNHFAGTRLSAKIIEEFYTELEWFSGVNVTKKVMVKNIGEAPAFVRISLYEYLLTFTIDTQDQTGNGNLAVSTTSVTPTVDFSNVKTWEPAANAGGTYTNKGTHYIAKKATIAKIPEDRYQMGQNSRDNTELKWFKINFSSEIYSNIPVSPKGDYWLYNDGYFYYSRLLMPGEISDPVMESVQLEASAPNKMKGSLYKLDPVMDAHDATTVLLDAWNISSTSPVYKLYENQLTQ